MKRFPYAVLSATLLAFCMVSTALSAQNTTGIRVNDPRLVRTDDGRMAVSMNLRLADLRLDDNRTAVFVPMIVNGSDARALAPVSVFGRTRWFQAQRAGEDLSDAIRHAHRPDVLSYSDSVPFEPWMEDAQLILRRQDFGCCDRTDDESVAALTMYEHPGEPAPAPALFVPVFRYVRPEVEAVKVRALSGSAYIDFPVNSTELLPYFRNNRAELDKIVATIDSLRRDADMTVTSVTIKGSASPEGDYRNNEFLARGRTEALRRYVETLYHFGPGRIASDWVAEDWEGLREYVAASSLPHRNDILRIIDDPYLDPDRRDAAIRARFTDEYRFLLENVFPALRRSDYRIEYSVRSYVDLDTIRRVMAESPQNLSVEEMFRLAETMEPGSAEYADVLETAARLFPANETANLNAGMAAMQRGDIERAARYLEKAGSSADADYARDILGRLTEQAR